MRIHQADELALHDERCLRQTAILFKVLEVRARLSIPNWHKQAIGADEKSSLPTGTCGLLSTQLFLNQIGLRVRGLRDVSEQEREDFVTAIAKAKNELGSHIARQQVGFKAYPSIDEQNRL